MKIFYFRLMSVLMMDCEDMHPCVLHAGMRVVIFCSIHCHCVRNDNVFKSNCLVPIGTNIITETYGRKCPVNNNSTIPLHYY